MAWISARCALRSTPPRNEVISTAVTRPALTVATALYSASPLQLTDGISGLPIFVQTMPAVILAGRGAGAGAATGAGGGAGRTSATAGGATWVDWMAGAGGAGAVTWNSGGGTKGGGGALRSGGGGTTFSGGGGGLTFSSITLTSSGPTTFSATLRAKPLASAQMMITWIRITAPMPVNRDAPCFSCAKFMRAPSCNYKSQSMTSSRPCGPAEDRRAASRRRQSPGGHEF
mmetsp:Transcript_43758/g.77171  ORF Transcript_43758/g.77171 Transcript_43758/m.77171 type:complete len:230 (-) Transcript_43758:679-1368(-)